jgi:hypothetical protein
MLSQSGSRLQRRAQESRLPQERLNGFHARDLLLWGSAIMDENGTDAADRVRGQGLFVPNPREGKVCDDVVRIDAENRSMTCRPRPMGQGERHDARWLFPWTRPLVLR